MLKITVLVTLYFFLARSQGDALQVGKYRAAVVELGPLSSPRSEIVMNHIGRYVEIIEKSVQYDIDIIVFPESLLTWGTSPSSRETLRDFALPVPKPEANAIPCDSDEFGQELRELSCAAKKATAYVIINTWSKEKGKCHEDGWCQHNMDVVFDRTGQIIARYRKFHLFGEKYLDVTSEPEVVTFDTDFGVTFGIFTCFDILFERPALELVQKQNIKHIVFPTMWFSEMPFLTGVQTQKMWSETHDVVLLASQATYNHTSSSGSGIYAGKSGAIQTFVQNGNETVILMAEIFKDGSEATPIEPIATKRPPELEGLELRSENFTGNTLTAMLNDSRQTASLCDVNFCCNASIVLVQNGGVQEPSYKYFLIAKYGKRSFTYIDGGIVACAVVACPDEQRCGSRLPTYNESFWSGDVEQIELTLELKHPPKRINVYPSTLKADLLPVPAKWYTFNQSQKVYEMVSKGLKEKFFTLGMYGRIYEMDGNDHQDGGASSFVVLPALIFAGVLKAMLL